ncbi:MAG: tetratricopeptide repeat protein [Deltaproteobacteria bacterium]|nr:tetratricopeptide repeat protein [Deltaproteobacteria bacterium]
MTSILDRHHERFQATPGDNQAFEALEEHYFLAGDWGRVIALYEHRLTAPALGVNRKELAQVRFRMGQVYQERLADSDRAIECFTAVLQDDPGNRQALTRLRRAHTEHERWDVALQIAEVECELPMRPSEHATLLAEIGSIWLDHLGDAEQSLTQFESALREQPEHRSALEGTARAYESCERFPEAAGAWERLVGQLKGSDRASAQVALARLNAGPLEQAERAHDLYRRALGDDPNNLDAIVEVAAQTEAREQWPALADLLERRFELENGNSERAEIAARIGRLNVEQLDNPSVARIWLERAAELGSDQPDVYETLADFARERSDDDALFAHLRQARSLIGESVPVSMLLELAALHSDRGEDEKAIVEIECALQRTPDDALAIESLSDALARQGRDEELIEVLERRAALAVLDPEARASAHAELGALFEDRLGDAEAARRAYEQAFEADPSTPGIATTLERLYRKSEDWESLRDFLEVAARFGPEVERIKSLCSLAALESDHFSDLTAAARTLEAALELDPMNPVVHRGLQHIAIESDDENLLLTAYRREADVSGDSSDRTTFLIGEVTRILESRGEIDEALDWLRSRIATRPDDLFSLSTCADLEEKLGDTEGLIATLEALEALLHTDLQLANLRRLAEAYGSIARTDDAHAAWERAVAIDPTDVESLRALAAHLEADGRLNDLADIQRRLADLLPAEARAECLDVLATLLADRLGDIDGAITVLARLNQEAHAPDDALERYEFLLERGERFEDLVRHLAQRATEVGDGSAVLDLRRARLLIDFLDRPRDAVDAYHAARQQAPESSEAAEGLERALRSAGDMAGLATFLAEQMEAEEEPNARDALAFEHAQLLEDELDDVQGATDSYRHLAESADSPALRLRATERFEALLLRSEDWAGLRNHLENTLAAAAEDTRPELHERLAKLCADQLDDPDSALEHFEQAAALDPSLAAVWRELAHRYEASGRNADLLAALKAELATSPDRDSELALQSRAAQLCAFELDDQEAALAHFERVLEIDPSHPAASEFVIDRCERAGDFDRVVELLEIRLSRLDAEPRDSHGPWSAQRCSLRVRIAKIRANEIDDLDGAIVVLEPALSEIGPTATVAEALAELYQRAEFTEDLIELCRSAATACEVEAERANWFVRLGDVLRGEGRDPDAATAYRQALTDRPNDREVQASLREIYRRLREDEPLVRLLEVELSHLAGADEVPTRLEIAEVLRRSHDRGAEALLHLRRILELDPGHHEALDQALELAPKLGASDALLELLDQALGRPCSDTERAALLAQRAQLLGDSLDRPALAIDDYREAISLDPTRSDGRIALRALLVARSDWVAVLDSLFEEASRERGEARGALFAQAAELAWEQLEPDAALPWLMRLREERPRDAENLARISEVHRSARRAEPLLRALAAEIPTAEAPLELHRERARIFENELGSLERALVALEEARAVDLDNVETLQDLERLYRLTERHSDRAVVLEQLLVGAGGDRRITLLCDASALYENHLGDPERAAAHLLTAVDMSRGSTLYPNLLSALGSALHDTGRTDAWARCAEAELHALDPEAPVFSDRRRELRRELATAYELRLGRPGAALCHLRELADLKWTETHGAGTGELDAIESALLRLLRAEGSWIEFETRLGTHVERHPDEVEAWRELARVREERLRTPVAANEAYRAVLALRPDDVESIRGLRRCSELVGDWEVVAEALRLELDHADDLSMRERTALLRRLGDVSWERLGSTTRASRAYASALECSPADFEALRSHQRLLEAMEDWSGAIDLYESEIEMLGNAEPVRRREASLRAGEIARDHTGEIERALRRYLCAAELAALSVDRRAELAELHRRNGDLEAYAEVFDDWCNDSEARAGAGDHRRLSEVLEQLGRTPKALASIERAAELEAESAEVWDSVARLRNQCDDPDGAADALELAAERLPDAEACARLHLAAALTEPRDAEKALDRYRAAARRDSADAMTAAALARLSSELGDFAEAVEMAERALDLGESGGNLDPELLRDTALVGARAARERGNDETAARLYSRVLADAPTHADALAEYGETLAGLGDLLGAQAALEARLERGESDDARALHLSMLGAALCASEDFETARVRLEEAVEIDPELDRAHHDLIAVYERLDRIDDGIGALERWADLAEAAPDRAARLLRAAEWELRCDHRAESAERHLRDAIEADTGITHAQVLLADHLWDQGRGDEALEVTSLALEAVQDSEARGSLTLVQGRAYEKRGDRREAAEAFGIAARENPRNIEAALSSARLLRGLGEWQPAADTLDAFAMNHPGDDAGGQADVLQQLGRLMAGPLEDVDGAISAYRRALELEPGRIDTRAALAEFLSHRPEDRDEALDHHEALLAEDPTHASSLRVLLRIAREQRNEAAIATGLGVLRALGIASPRELEEETPSTTLHCAGKRELADPLWEKLRRIASEASREIAQALEASPSPSVDGHADPASTFRAAAIAAEGEISAAALIPLTEQELGEALTVTAAIALDPEHIHGDGRLLNAMSSAIRRRLRRRIRRILANESLERIAAVDFGAWRTEVRALASAIALDQTDGDLRTALAVLISEESDRPVLDLPADADLTPYVAAYPLAQSLMRRIVHTWLASLK